MLDHAMRRFAAALVAVLAFAGVAEAQVPPPILPANTVWGRLGIGPGPGQAIPFSIFASRIAPFLGFCNTLGGFPTGTGTTLQCSTVPGSLATLNGGPLTITAADNSNILGLSITSHGGFWTDNTPGLPITGVLNKMQDRLFVDAATCDSGFSTEGSVGLPATNPACVGINTAGWSWSNQGASIAGLSSVARIGVLGQAVASTSDAVVGPLPIGVAGFAYIDTINGFVAGWGGYFECAVANSTGNGCVGNEIDVGNVSTLHPFLLYPNSGRGGDYNTLGQWFLCGGSIKAPVNYANCSAAWAVNNNPGVSGTTPAWDKGGIFTPASLSSHSIAGVGSVGYALNFADAHALVWWRNDGSNSDQLEAFIASSNTTTGTALSHDIQGLYFTQAVTSVFSENLWLVAPNSTNVAAIIGQGATGDRAAKLGFGASATGSFQDFAINRQAGANGNINFTNTGTGSLNINLNGLAVAGLGSGLKLGTPTGGDKGLGTVNATGCYVNGVACAVVGTTARILLTTPLTVYVSVAGGGNCLAIGTPCTPATAMALLAASYDFGGQAVTMQFADGTYGAFNVLPWVGAGSFILQGNTGARTNVILAGSNDNAIAILAPLPGPLIVRFMRVSSTGTGSLNGNGIFLNVASNVFVDNIDFAACGFAQMLAQSGGTIANVQGALANAKPIFISAGAAAHAWGSGGTVAIVGTVTVTLSGTPAFSGGFARALGLGHVEYGYGVTFSGSATGPKFNGQLLSAIDTGTANVEYLPGTASSCSPASTCLTTNSVYQ